MIVWAPAGPVSAGAGHLRKWSIALSAGKCPGAHIPKVLCSSALPPWGPPQPPHHPPTKGSLNIEAWSASHQGLPAAGR